MTTINFFGTHNFATTILQELINCPDIQIQTVFTMPDRPVGRKRELQASPVKLLAQKNNLNIQQPAKLNCHSEPCRKGEESLRQSPSNDAERRNPSTRASSVGMTTTTDLNIVVDYGMIIPQNIIDAPKYGTINVHPSLLPKYRGPSPIQSVLLNGETQTGISVMLIDSKMDHGPILEQKTINIDQDDTYPTLSVKLAQESATMITKTIKLYIEGQINPQPQDHDQATFCKILNREDGLINFNKTAQEIYNQYRGLIPWPGIYSQLNNLRLKLLKIKPASQEIAQGKIVFQDDQIFIGCKQGSIEVLELQLEGKKAMDAKSFINGNQKLSDVYLG